MKNRVISGVIIGIIDLATIYVGGWLFDLLLAFIVGWGLSLIHI